MYQYQACYNKLDSLTTKLNKYLVLSLVSITSIMATQVYDFLKKKPLFKILFKIICIKICLNQLSKLKLNRFLEVFETNKV